MTNKNNPKYQSLVAKLREIFQIDRPELDFGIYRILNARAGEVNDYLDNRLAAKVQAALNSGSDTLREQLTRELKEKEAQYQADPGAQAEATGAAMHRRVRGGASHHHLPPNE